MLFNSLTYAYFFAVVFVVSWLLTRWPTVRFVFLLVGSYYFYAEWSARYVPLIFIASTIDWVLGYTIGAAKTQRTKKILLIATIAMNTGLLAYYKYWNFGAETISWVANALGLPLADVSHQVELPLGISFFTFMSLSYVIDVYRGHLEAEKNYLHYLTYIAIFPHLIAGPIIRGRDLLPLFRQPVKLTAENAGEGLFLIAGGLFKKIVIGDYLAVNLVDRVFAEPTSYSAVECLVAMYAYAVQVYCDFSGYSDIAIGSALLLGYRFKINFDAPFKSTNIVEFWRRWHISLSSWLRDYIYIPLGGGRSGTARKYLNVFLTMVLCGLWHGAAWTYVIFGMIQGAALVVTHWVQDRRGSVKPKAGEPAVTPGRILSVAACFTFVAITFAMFRAESWEKSMLMYERLLTFTTFTPNLHTPVLLIILGALVIQWTPRSVYERARGLFIAAPAPAQAAALFLLGLALREAATAEAVPFVYFQF